MKTKKAIALFLSIPKTIYFNFCVLPLREAIRLPFLVGYKTRFGHLSKNVIVQDLSKPFQIKLNWFGTDSREEERRGFVSIGEKGHISFAGKSHFSSGLSLIVDDGELAIGGGFFCNKNCCISCNAKITIGNDVMWGWNVELLDSDNHNVLVNGIPKITKAPIIIHDNVWLASYVNVLKGVIIATGSVVAYRSLVVNDLIQEHCLYGGSPAKLISENVSWSRKLSNV